MLKRLTMLVWITLGVWSANPGCASTAAEKSTGTNWIECDSDADCRVVPGAECGNEGVCVDREGNKIAATAVIRDGGMGLSDGGTGEPVEAATDGQATANLSDAEPTPNDGSTGVIAIDCYSPGQNLERALDYDGVGCECHSNARILCISGFILDCLDGHWQFGEACGGCWEPIHPDYADAYPEWGCACDSEGQTACAYSQFTGYLHATCTDGRWQAGTDKTPCATCSSDLECPVGSRCEGNACQPLTGIPCKVNGVLYPDGTDGIPDPTSCNTCMCANGGYLGCTTIACPEPEHCPTGTTRATVCDQCGLLGDCATMVTGCIPACETSADCQEGTACDGTQGACTAVCF